MAGRVVNPDGYAQFDAPGTMDQLVEALRLGHGIALPGADLLLSNLYEVLVAGIKESKHIGRGVIDGLECEHLAFRNFDTEGTYSYVAWLLPDWPRMAKFGAPRMDVW